MYVIKYKKGSLPKALKGLTFKTYDMARVALRKFVRTKLTLKGQQHPTVAQAKDLGYTISKV